MAPSSREIITAVRIWQSSPIHQLTCRRVSSHRPLEPAVEGEQVILRCPECDYRQTWIPQSVVQAVSNDHSKRRLR